MLSKRGRKSVDMALVAGLLMEFSAILHPKGARWRISATKLGARGRAIR